MLITLLLSRPDPPRLMTGPQLSPGAFQSTPSEFNDVRMGT